MRLDGGAMYGHVPKNVWETWTPADPSNRISLACRTLFIQTDDGRNVLFDVGVGNFFPPNVKERYCIETKPGLISTLANIGISESDINIIILSHLHFDHAGGLLSSYEKDEPVRLLFPKATYYVSNTHWERACHPHVRERASFIPSLPPLLEKSKRLVFIENTTHSDLDFGLTFSFSHGHTTGLLHCHLDLPSGPLVLASDLIPGVPWVHLPITTGYDRYGELIVDEKEKLLRNIAAKKGHLLFSHDFAVSCASISQDENKKYFAEQKNIPELIIK